MRATRTNRRLHIVSPRGRLRRSSTALARPCLMAWMRSQAARYALWMHAWVDGCDDVMTTTAITKYVVRG
eukprot:4760988-Pleurochrysis_carterae.AAC.1